MEKSREARSSSSTVAANGSSRRRSRATAFRDLPGSYFDSFLSFLWFFLLCVILLYTVVVCCRGRSGGVAGDGAIKG